ncbi:MAG: hypothetical protein J6C62_07990 [Clostridia bacterium]|nr:hypothetical protein [Clostridia bacterium]
MKRKLLSIILALSALFTCTFSVFGSGCNLLPQKDDFTKRVEAIENSCVIGVNGVAPSTNKTEIMYMISKTRLYLYVDNGYTPSQTAVWVAENNAYKYWVFNENTELFEEVPGKSKAEYENARKNMFYLMFGCFAKNSKEFEYNEKDLIYTNSKPLVYTYNNTDISSALGQPAGTTFGTVYHTFDDIVIQIDSDGKITEAEYKWVESYDATSVTFTYECELSYNEYEIPHPDEMNAQE